MILKTLAMTVLMAAAAPLSAQVTQGPETSQIPQLAEGEGRQVAERLAHELETSYTDLTVGARYASRLRAQATRGAYDQGNWKELTERVNADLTAVQPDGHLHLFASTPSSQPPGEAPSESDPHEPQVDGTR